MKNQFDWVTAVLTAIAVFFFVLISSFFLDEPVSFGWLIGVPLAVVPTLFFCSKFSEKE